MGVIYKITNQINGMIYIGQTTQGLQNRWIHHVAEAKKDHKKGGWSAYLHRAIIKYGRENFSVEVVENGSNDKLNEREIYWIAYYHSNDKDIGYNLTYGGEGTVRIDYNEVYRLWDDGLSTFQIAEKLHIARGTALYILQQYKNYSDEESRKRRGKNITKAKRESVSQYDLHGNFIAEYTSSFKAAQSVEGAGRYAVKKCCEEQCGISGGYQWRYSKDPAPEAFHGKAKGKQKPIIQMDLDDNIIAKFKCLKEASEQTRTNMGSICSCCSGLYKTANGFKWRYDMENG